MANFIIHDSSGLILRTGSCPDSMVDIQARVGEFIVLGTADDSAQYIESDTVKDMPLKPSETALFDYVSKSWYESADKVRALKGDAVIKLFSSKLVSDIAYSGSLLDADATAQSNLKSKLQELAARIALGNPVPSNQLLWRCADNTVVTFTTQDEYHNWLLGYAIALSERGTALYMAKWQHQAAIAGLSAIGYLQAYDVTLGW